MNNIDLKSQIGAGAFFKQSTKNELSKNMVASFDQKSAYMNLNQESTKEKELKNKRKAKNKNDPYKSASESEKKPTESPKEYIKKLMNII